MKKQLSILFLVFAAFLSACDRPNQQPYRAGILTDEFIYDTASFPSVHAATIAETPAGLISAFFMRTSLENRWPFELHRCCYSYSRLDMSNLRA